MQKHSDEFNLLKIGQVATMLGISTKTLRRMIKNGQIPAIKLGTQWRIRESQLKKWFQERENNGFSAQKRPDLE